MPLPLPTRAIIAALDHSGLDDTEAARQIGVTRMTIWRWRNGQRMPSYADALKISQVTGVPLVTPPQKILEDFA